MNGPVALHGGGEFLPGDEPFLRALLAAATPVAERRATDCGRAGSDEPLRIVIVPTAGARHDPDAAARLGTAAFERVAAEPASGHRPLRIETARVVDDVTVQDPEIAARIAAADLVHFPGGDPDLVPAVVRPETAAWRAILAARARGAVLAGASAGAMALAEQTWTPGGVVPGLGVVPGIVVFPHADAGSWPRAAAWFQQAAAARLGILGLGERTAVLSDPASARGATLTWRVVGAAEVRWLPPGADTPVVLRDGETLDLPA